MKIEKNLRDKIRLGDGITDKELNTALDFYLELSEALQCLGPTFHFAWREAFNTLELLRGFRYARDRVFLTDVVKKR